MTAGCWVPGSDLPGPDGWVASIHHLPYGVFQTQDRSPRVGVAIGPYVLDLAELARAEADEPMATGSATEADGFDAVATFERDSLNPLMAAGPRIWELVRAWVTDRLTDPARRAVVEPWLVPRDQVDMRMPFEVADYVDFYASEQHATNLGRIMRPGDPPLLPNWKRLPVGYHGRAGTVVPSGSAIPRPHGQRLPAPGEPPEYGPTAKLDIEAEVGFVVGVGSRQPIPVDRIQRHVFGVVLLNDWTARDIQAWEARPLGPFLGKSFRTSIAAWVTPWAVLDTARIPGPAQEPEPAAYLRSPDDPGLDLDLEVRLNGTVISRPPYREMYWTPGQMLAHCTVNGAWSRTGDLFASGTVSGVDPGTWGSITELTWDGTNPLTLPDGSTRAFLSDGDEVVIAASAPGPDGTRLELAPVAGRVVS